MRLPAVFCKKNGITYMHVRGQQLFHPSVLPRHVDGRSSCLLPHNRALLISVCEFEGGGLNCKAKAQVLVVTPPPLFFLKVGRKKGECNSGAVQYMCNTYEERSKRAQFEYAPYTYNVHVVCAGRVWWCKAVDCVLVNKF